MAELPHIGRHCDAELCHLLDFLPVRCDACSGTFCLSHFTYEGHNCKNAYKKNVQVPVCPVCDKPVPTPKGVSADAQVNEHILNNCAAITKKKVFANKCSVKGCKKKELVPVRCPSCKHNFCLGHRHEKDHDCEQLRKTPPFFKAAAAAIARNQGGQNCASQARTTQMSEDEALARALAESLNDVQLSPEERDRRLAEQLQQQEYAGRNAVGQRNQRSSAGNTNNCTIS
ncbi:AN1-like Zinc finger [Ancylostoma caninum]|uniref:AN1-like Zinc finger n=1 Tax=Ancylostoma caninum TaxID=29170 RepID=A0A368G4J3_ANCCA|nr:AN1-like Zinc finger [Ancylostoma caninum]